MQQLYCKIQTHAIEYKFRHLINARYQKLRGVKRILNKYIFISTLRYDLFLEEAVFFV